MSGVEKRESIVIRDAWENNLKHITVAIPVNKFTCVVGPSGCGKSSLIFDTLYAESQRNVLESLSGNLFGVRLMDKPKVESIENLKVAMILSQNYYNVNPRSVVGTVSDISYYLRSIFAFLYSRSSHKKVDINYFSPNNPASCCKNCDGTGEGYFLSEDALMPDKTKTLAKGGILYFKGSSNSMEYRLLETVTNFYNIDINKRVEELTKEEMYYLMYQEEEREFSIKYKTPKGRYKSKSVCFTSVMVELRKLLKQISIPSTFQNISKYLIKGTCGSCNGKKLKEDILDIRICGKNISDVEDLQITEINAWCNEVEEYCDESEKQQIVALLDAIRSRVKHFLDLNLGYLCLSRSIPTLSTGETQRVRLANQMNSSLNGLLYILDEPCKGLHVKNIEGIIKATKNLVKLSNTVVAIEHNKAYISQADKVIEMGPAGGRLGGYILNETYDQKTSDQALAFKLTRDKKEYIEIKDVNRHNLKDVSVKIPLGCITCVTGVSGSGKSTLVSVIVDSIDKKRAIDCSDIKNARKIKRVQKVDQQPIGKTPRSTVVSYLGIYDAIRNIYADTIEAKALGLNASAFSINVEGGRCECCQGTGKEKVDLKYLPETYILCRECGGKRFQGDVLSVRYKGKSIVDILDSPISDISSTFEEHSSVARMLECMQTLGLGYLSLGQMSMSLSGGESQRVKLAKALGNKVTGNNLYVLDEPTTGLHETDVQKLNSMLDMLVDAGETIVIIEHDLEFISTMSDYVIDMGDKAGLYRSDAIVQGEPVEVIQNPHSSWEGYKEYVGYVYD